MGGHEARPVALVFLFGGNAKGDASIERHTIELDVESVAIGVWPDAADACPDAFFALTVAYLVGDVGWGFARLAGLVIGFGHGRLLFGLSGHAHRGLMANQ